MSSEKELLNILDDESMLLPKRLKLANNAFISSELHLQHKEAFIFNWLINKIDTGDEDVWKLLNRWLQTNNFIELTRNHTSSEEITKIFMVLTTKIKDTEHANALIVIDSLIALMENHRCQQYFKCNIDKYFELIANVLNSLDRVDMIKEFLSKIHINKDFKASENFLKYFLEILVPSFEKCLATNEELFEVFSGIIQKCVFYNNKKTFGAYMLQFFEGKTEEKQTGPKILFKYLLSVYKTRKPQSPTYFKLFFHALSTAYENDFTLVYQFFVLTIQILGFDLNGKMIFFKTSTLNVPENELCLHQSQEILLALLECLVDLKTDLSCTLKELTFSNFLKNLYIEFLYLNVHNVITLKIFQKMLTIEPLLIQSVCEETICYAMLSDNTGNSEQYNELVITIFNIYTRLHRVENLVSKMVEALNNGLHGHNTKIKSFYTFRGIVDHVKYKNDSDFEVENILTTEILECFSKCICQLASWQVINVFKTLLHFLNQVLENIDSTENENLQHCIFVQIVSELIKTFLCNIRIAEHTVAANVVEKSVKCLNDLKSSLKVFGTALVKREHNHRLMRSFLTIAYYWAEIQMTLKYYGSNEEFCNGVLDNNFTACNISYTHPYLNDREWCLLSERISNFGEAPCKHLLHKLYLQKLRALLLFEVQFNEDIKNNIVRTAAIHSKTNWRDMLEDRFVVEYIVPRMEPTIVASIAENLVKHFEKLRSFEIPTHVVNSTVLLNAVHGVVLSRINKMLSKNKRKHDEDLVSKSLSSKIFATLPGELFMKQDFDDVISRVKDILRDENGVKSKHFEGKINEEKLCNVLEIIKHFPIVFSHQGTQKVFLMYLLAIHKDFSKEFSQGNLIQLQNQIENFIFGVLQHCKFRLSDIFDMNQVNSYVVKNFQNWEEHFTLVNENVFKYENFVEYFETFVEKITKNLKSPKYTKCSVILINIINKLKKVKMPKEVKKTADAYKTTICDEISRLVEQETPQEFLLVGYAYSLRQFFSQNDAGKESELLKHLNTYVDYAMMNPEKFNTAGHLILFITVLQNKSKIPDFDDGWVYKFWNALKGNLGVCRKFDECLQLVVLIMGNVSNETFPGVMSDLLGISENAISEKDFELFGEHCKIWEAVLSGNLNPIKTKTLQLSLENLLEKVAMVMKSFDTDDTFYENVFNFEKTLISANQLHLTALLIDALLINVTIVLSKTSVSFNLVCSLAISTLTCLLKHRKSLIMDRLPSFLMQYRLILRCLCKKSNSDLELDESGIRDAAECAHQLEKLTRTLVGFPKDMKRIAMYVIADILEQYEQVTLYPNVKMHLNNCIYSLISVCDQHAVNFLMRVLSPASTEIFKIMYDNHKKYYRFTGKV